MITLDSLNLERINFMKIDVQGSERLLMWGARETIKRCKPIINIEMSDPNLQFVMSAAQADEMQVRRFDVTLFIPSAILRTENVTTACQSQQGWRGGACSSQRGFPVFTSRPV